MVESSATISPIVHSESAFVLWVSRRRHGTAVSSLYCDVCTGSSFYERARNGFVTLVLAELIAGPGGSRQDRERARGLQSVREVTQLVAYCHYWRRSRAVVTLSRVGFG